METALHYSVIQFVANLLVQVTALAYVLSLPRKPDYLQYFAFYLAGWVMNSMNWTGFATFLHPAMSLFFYLGFPSAMLSYFLAMFAYAIGPVASLERERSWFRVLGAIWGAGPVLHLAWVTHDLKPTMISSREAFGYPFGSAFLHLGITFASLTGWALFVFLRKRIHHANAGRLSEAVTMARFAVPVLILFIDFSLYVAMSFGYGDYDSYRIIHPTLVTLTIFIETVILLNAMPQHTSFLAKVVGATLVLTLTIISLLAVVVFREHEQITVERMRNRVILAAENLGGAAALPIAYIRRTNNAGKSEVLYRSVPEELIPKEGGIIGVPYTGVAGDGTRVEQCYKSIRVEHEGFIYEGGRPLADYLRQDVQPMVIRFLIALFCAYLLVLLLLPLFFRSNLVRPLAELLTAVKRVDQGDYNFAVPVRHADEIGELARSFNVMIEDLKTYREEREKTMQIIHENQLQVERSRLDARLTWLKRAIQPHFVMNSLNTIVGLIREDPARAQELVRSLGQELRAMLDVVSERTIPASVELGLCRSHVQIMSYRHEQAHKLEITGFTGDEQVPPFVFHTLVENAFTHHSGEAGILLRICRASEPGRNTYVFESRADDRSPSPERTGTQYVKSRLEDTYPGRWTMDQGIEAGRWRVRITVPN